MRLTDERRLCRNKMIADAGRDTRHRRSRMACKTFELKVQYNKLNKKQKDQCFMLFVEAKRYYNDIIGFVEKSDINKYDWKNTIVTVKNQDGAFEKKEIEYLPASERQAIIAQIKASMKALNHAKKSGRRVGRLGFVSEVNQITLKQPSINYGIDCRHERVRVQGVSGWLKVRGLQQIGQIEGSELSFARFVHTPLGYFLKITVYFPDAHTAMNSHNGKCIGIDFGCATSFITSEGENINASMQESDRLKRLSRKANRIKAEKRSEHKKHLYYLLSREYAKMGNRKKDMSRKIASRFKKYDKCVIQDEMLKKWKESGHGKAVQHSCLGYVKSRLMLNDNIVVLDKSLPTTKLCRECGAIHHEMTQKDRAFICSCGVKEDRDVHAAKNMLWFADHNIGVIQVGTEHTKLTHGEFEPLIERAVKSDRDQVRTLSREASCPSGKR